MSHKFDVSKKEKLESPQRKALLPADKVIEYLNLKKTDIVADIGCGTGYITLPLAQKLSDGKVYAIDISQELLCEVEKKIEAQQISNIIPILSSENHFPIDTDSVDLALLVMVFHEVNDKMVFAREIERVVNSHGRVAILEWSKCLEYGPPMNHRVSEEEMMGIFDSLGFSIKEKHELNPSIYLHIYGK